ncbi:hypothetical protein C8R21_12524 [Nitrosospira multiformis]|uniref:Uncharacterized protein n=1 Tax=Nitrosospira multiformis TaxID=1231 RepID=A0A2T5I705_9PROT|nr:hypothetical protein C8R21_12524 [Nitrosospira multiformis]
MGRLEAADKPHLRNGLQYQQFPSGLFNDSTKCETWALQFYQLQGERSWMRDTQEEGKTCPIANSCHVLR